MSPKPLQKILFGSPGTGKSYKIREIAQQELKIEFDDNSCYFYDQRVNSCF
ncbi:MAG: hypothetical protein AB4057_10500 [Crocosphaera sp.]